MAIASEKSSVGEQTIIVAAGESEPTAAFVDHLRHILATAQTPSPPGEVSLELPCAADLTSLLPLWVDVDAQLSARLTEYFLQLGERAIPMLVIALEHENREIQQKAISLLGNIGSDSAIVALIHCLENADGTTAMELTGALKQIGQRCIPALLDAFENPQALSRPFIAYALWEIGDEQAVERLLNALSDPDIDVRSTAAVALGKIKGPRVAQTLTETLVRNSQAIAQYEREGKAELMFPVMALQAHLAMALIEMGAVSVPLLIEALAQSSDVQLYKTAVSILGKIGDLGALDPLINIASYHEQIDAKLLLETISALENLKDRRSLPMLSEILWSKGKSKSIYESLIKTISTIAAPEAETAMIQALHHEESAVRYYAVMALNKRRCGAAVEELIALVDDPSPLVHAQALAALENLGLHSLAPLLTRLSRLPLSVVGPMAKLVKRIGQNAVAKLQEADHTGREESVAILTRIIDFAVTPPKILTTEKLTTVTANRLQTSVFRAPGGKP